MIVADPEIRDVIAFLVGVDIWDMSLYLACATIRGWMISRAAKSGDQEELDRIRLSFGYLELTTHQQASVTLGAMSVEDKIKQAMLMQTQIMERQAAQAAQAASDKDAGLSDPIDPVNPPVKTTISVDSRGTMSSSTSAWPTPPTEQPAFTAYKKEDSDG